MKEEAKPYSNKTPGELAEAAKVVGAFLTHGTVTNGQFTMGRAHGDVALDETGPQRRPLSTALLALEQSGCQLPWLQAARVKWMRLLLKVWEYALFSTADGIELYHDNMHSRYAPYLMRFQYGPEFSDLSDRFLAIMNIFRAGPETTKWQRRMWLHIQIRAHCTPGDNASDPTVMVLLLQQHGLPQKCPPEK